MTQHEQTTADKMLTQGQLNENMDLLRAVIAGTSDAIYVKDLEGRYLLFNESAERISGKRAEDVLGKDDTSLFPDEEARHVMAEDRSVITSGATMTFEDDLITATGERKHFLSTKGPIFDNSGTLSGTFGITRDITERKQMEIALQESEKRYRGVVEDQSDLINRFLPDGTLTFVNDVFCRFLGKSREEVEGKPWQPMPVPEDLPHITEQLNALAPDNPVVVIENRVYSGTGEVRWMQFVNRGFFDQEGRLVETQAVGRDITERKLAEEALRLNEKRLRLALDAAHLASWDWDFVSDTLVWSHHFYTMLGYEPYSFTPTYRHWAERVHPDDLSMAEARVHQAMVQPGDHRLEYRVLLPDGTVRILEALFRCDFDSAGALARAYGIVSDITKRRQMEEELRRLNEDLEQQVAERTAALVGTNEQLLQETAARQQALDALNEKEQRLQLYLDRMPIGHTVWDLDFRAVSWNPAAEKIFGFTAAEAMGKIPYEFIVSPKVKVEIASLMERLFAGDFSAHSINENLTKDGRTIICEWHNTPLFDPQGRMTAVMSMVQDVTERVQSEKALRQSEAKLHLAQQSAGAGIWDWDISHGQIDWAPELFHLFGLDPDSTVAGFDVWRNVLHPDDRQMAEERIERAIQNRTPLQSEYRVILPTGEIRWINALGDTIYSDIGQPLRMLGICLDITEHKRTEEALQASEAKYRQLYETMRDAFVVTDIQGHFIEVNRAYQKMLGYTPDELMQLTYPDITPAKWHAMEARLVEEQIVRRGYSDLYEKEYIRKDGTVFPVELRTILIRDTDGQPAAMWAIIRDITERKQMEADLRQSEERFRALVETTSDCIWEVDAQGRFTYLSPRFQDSSGYLSTEFIGRTPLDLIQEDEGRKFGEHFLHIVDAQQPFTFEHPTRHRNGRMMTVEVSGVPFFSPEGEYLGMRGITRDITEVKKAREEQVKTQKLESLGLLAGGIAHDFNNLLTAIVGNISLAEFQRNNPEAVTELLKEAEDAAVQARKLTQQLLTFAKGGEPVKTVIAVGPLVRETTAFTTRGSDVMCEFSLPDDLWPVAADEGQLSQVFHNLAMNAVQAMPDGGTLTIGAMNVFSLTEARRYVVITVTDTGVGIPEKHLPKIFDPYYSTKHHGSGLGLATCHSILAKHGGTIKVKSTPGRGTTFSVRLPAAAQAVIPENEPRQEVARGSGRVLVMDDERPVRKIVQAMLESLGYSVKCTSDGNEAIECYREQLEEGCPYDVVILDLTIPGGKGGKETVRDLLKFDPNARVIVSSGYSTDAVLADYQDYGFCAILGKPYRLQDLSDVLVNVLGV